MPESEVSLDGILAVASPKVDLLIEQLILLDSGFLPVTGGDKGDFFPYAIFLCVIFKTFQILIIGKHLVGGST